MNKKILVLLTALCSTNSFAGYVFNLYENIGNSPFSIDQITEFQVGSSLAQYSKDQYSEEQRAEFEDDVRRNIEVLKDGRAKLALVTTEEGNLVGVSWIKPSSDFFEPCQTNTNIPEIYDLIGQRAFDLFPTATHMRLSVNSQRPLKSVLIKKYDAQEIPIFDGRDPAKFTALRIERSNFLRTDK
jgi:hypothetical protein